MIFTKLEVDFIICVKDFKKERIFDFLDEDIKEKGSQKGKQDLDCTVHFVVYFLNLCLVGRENLGGRFSVLKGAEDDGQNNFVRLVEELKNFDNDGNVGDFSKKGKDDLVIDGVTTIKGIGSVLL